MAAETETEADEARLRQMIEGAAREWKQTVDAVESPILVLNSDGTIRRLNRAARDLTGMSFKELIGKKVGDVSSSQPWSQAAEIVRSMGPRFATQRCEVHDASSNKTWELSATVFVEPINDEARITIVARDLTQLVELQQSLRRSELMSALGALVAGIAHQARNPLFGLTTTLDAFQARFGENKDHQRYLDVLSSEAQRLSSLMEDLLEYGRPEAIELRPGRMEDVGAAAMRACEPLAQASGVRLELDVTGPLRPVAMDAGRLQQVFQNLIKNAVQHSPAQGLVSLQMRQENAGADAWIEGSIRDQGAGFAEADAGKLFQPFFFRRRGGTGLGLSIAKRIVEEHHGKISASNHPGGGSVMVLRLPCVPHNPPP